MHRVDGVRPSRSMTDTQQAAQRLAYAVTAFRLTGHQVDPRAVEHNAAAVLGEPAFCTPPADHSPTAQLAWATAEIASLTAWIDTLPESLARICAACAEIGVEAIRELAELKSSTAEAELSAVAARTARS